MTSSEPSQKPILFLVDDAPDMRTIGKLVLSQEGYDVRTFANGKEALDALIILQAIGQSPNVLVTDGNMPVMDGGTLLHEARKLFPNLPMVLGSGKSLEFTSDAKKTNSELLGKPYQVAELTGAIAKAKVRVSGNAPGDSVLNTGPSDAPPVTNGGYREQNLPQGHHRPTQWTPGLK